MPMIYNSEPIKLVKVEPENWYTQPHCRNGQYLVKHYSLKPVKRQYIWRATTEEEIRWVISDGLFKQVRVIPRRSRDPIIGIVNRRRQCTQVQYTVLHKQSPGNIIANEFLFMQGHYGWLETLNGYQLLIQMIDNLRYGLAGTEGRETRIKSLLMET